VSGAYGFNNIVTHDRTTLAGLDLTYKWTPAGRAHYRTLIFRNEIFYNRHEEFNRTFDSFGFYSYITNKIGARSWIGLRVDYSELPGDRENYASSISPYFDFWQSEFVMLRMQYSYTHRSDIESDHSIQIQTVWSMGPHKHEAY
jgi:hypothetical protein